jgi:manganese transport system ATP-binding protein
MSDVAIRAQSLVLGYGSTVALASSSFEIPRGKVTVVIGPNGSGKSTLLSAIAGLIAPAGGDIEVLQNLDAVPRISYVLQTTKVNDALPISVREVVMMGRYANAGAYRWLNQDDRDAVSEAMDRTGIANLASRHLNDLSGGQRQRVFVAQGLAQDHDLLLLDEPLTGIDLPTALAIDLVIHDELKRGCTVIMTTHDLTEAQVADNVVLLSGRVVACGSPDEVLTPDNLREAYGAALLHVENDRIFIDDAAHAPVPGRHLHRYRTIHTESSRSDLHKDDKQS